MIKDPEVFKKTSNSELITRELIHIDPQLDYQGTRWGLYDRRSRFNMFQMNFRPYFNVLQHKLPYPKTFEQTFKGIFDFNSYYPVNNVILGHFQLHQCCAAITEKDVLYTSTIGVSKYNTVTGRTSTVMDTGKVESIDYSKKLGMITGSTMNDSIYVYDINNKKMVIKDKLLPAADLMNGSVFVDEPTDSLLCCGNNEYVLHYDLATQQPIQHIKSIHYVNQIAYRPTNKLVAFAMDHTSVQIRSLKDPQCNIEFVGHDDFNFAVTFMDDNTFASGGQDCSTRIWDIRKPNQPLHLLDGYYSEVGAFCWDNERKLLFCCEIFGYVYGYDFKESVIKRKTYDFFSLITGLSFGPSKRTLFATLSDHKPGLVKFDITDN